MTTTLSTGIGSRVISSSLTASPGAFDTLPILDLSKDSEILAQEFREASMSSGFMYLINHGIPEEVISEALQQAKLFFAQSVEEKLEIDMNKSTNFKGFQKLMGEKVDPASRGDVHEAFDMGTVRASDLAKEPPEGQVNGNQFPNPERLPKFRPALEAAWDGYMALGKRLVPLIAASLDLEPTYFDDKFKNPGCVMRVLHYPPQEGEIDPRALGIGAHSDYECFTLLAQDHNKALQVLNVKGEWIEANPIKGALVLNLGDQLAQATNDLYLSTIHRAINRTGVDRSSMPFFFGMDYDATLAVLPSCISEDRPARYEPINAGEWIEKRLAETYVKTDE